MLASLSEFKFFQMFRVPIEEVDDVRFSVEIGESENSVIMDAKLVDLSVNGLGFTTVQKIVTGQKVFITLHFKKYSVDAVGKIVRSFSGTVEHGPIYGVELESDGDLKKLLERLIFSFSYERLQDCLVNFALTERYTTASEGFEMFSLLLSLFDDMSHFGDKKDFIDNMLEEVCRILNAERSSLFLINTTTNELEAVAALGTDPEKLRFDFRMGVAGSVFTTGVSLNIDTIHNKSRFNKGVDSVTGFDTKSIVCHPIHNREDKIIGVIEVLNKRNEDRFTIEDEKAMKVISLVFSSLYHNYNPISQTSQIRRFSRPSNRKYTIIGKSEHIGEVRNSILIYKDLDSPLLIEGENGVGKTLLAQILHYEGNKGPRPFEIVECSEKELVTLENNLFGIEQIQGKIEVSKGGTLVLKNIGKLSMRLQKRLYNVLTGDELIGNEQDLDIRLICTTSINLLNMVDEGLFSQELYQNLAQGYLELAPLRRRREDIPSLVKYFLRDECKRQGYLIKNFSANAMEQLNDYHWPGNVEELRVCIVRAVMNNPKVHIINFLKSDVVSFFDRDKASRIFDNIPYASDYQVALKDRLAIIERQIILEEIKRNDGNKSKASLSMGISRESLRKKLIYSENLVGSLEKQQKREMSKLKGLDFYKRKAA